jgi:hypothetical protein
MFVLMFVRLFVAFRRLVGHGLPDIRFSDSCKRLREIADPALAIGLNGVGISQRAIVPRSVRPPYKRVSLVSSFTYF